MYLFYTIQRDADDLDHLQQFVQVLNVQHDMRNQMVFGHLALCCSLIFLTFILIFENFSKFLHECSWYCPYSSLDLVASRRHRFL